MLSNTQKGKSAEDLAVNYLIKNNYHIIANILVFERMKEELRSGRTLASAIRTGFSRAWPSIRDGHVSTLLSTIPLYIFGSNFGASIVKGFAITLFIGTAISLFTCMTVTHTFMRVVFDQLGEKPKDKPWTLGL